MTGQRGAPLRSVARPPQRQRDRERETSRSLWRGTFCKIPEVLPTPQRREGRQNKGTPGTVRAQRRPRRREEERGVAPGGVRAPKDRVKRKEPRGGQTPLSHHPAARVHCRRGSTPPTGGLARNRARGLQELAVLSSRSPPKSKPFQNTKLTSCEKQQHRTSGRHSRSEFNQREPAGKLRQESSGPA